MLRTMYRDDNPEGISVDDSQVKDMGKHGWSLDKPEKSKKSTSGKSKTGDSGDSSDDKKKGKNLKL